MFWIIYRLVGTGLTLGSLVVLPLLSFNNGPLHRLIIRKSTLKDHRNNEYVDGWIRGWLYVLAIIVFFGSAWTWPLSIWAWIGTYAAFTIHKPEAKDVIV